LVTFKTITKRAEVVAVDIPTMAAMSPEDYEAYIRNDLFFVDSNDVLREQPAGGYPIAATREQMRVLIDYLEETASAVEGES
jgi:hypothetical protein